MYNLYLLPTYVSMHMGMERKGNNTCTTLPFFSNSTQKKTCKSDVSSQHFPSIECKFSDFYQGFLQIPVTIVEVRHIPVKTSSFQTSGKSVERLQLKMLEVWEALSTCCRKRIYIYIRVYIYQCTCAVIVILTLGTKKLL